jgi:glycosyltransferase involved in cell wall biosynthesis
LRRFGPDVVFVDEEPWSLSMAQAVWICRRARLPVVAYTKQNILKALPLPFRLIERQTYAVVGSIAVISEEVGEILRQKGYTGRCPMLVHGCDLSLFQPADSARKRAELGLQGVVIGFMGRLVSDKGLDTLIEAARLLHQREPDLSFSLLFVGAGAQEADLRRQADEAGLGELCRFCGAVPHIQAGEYMNCMDLFVLPSRTRPNWKEQFGRVIVEALACHVPVIGSDSGQIPHVIADTGGGLIFKEGDASDLATKLASLISDPARRAALGAEGGQSVRCRYTYEAVARQLHEILERACER